MTEVIFKGREIEVFRKGKMKEEKSIGSEGREITRYSDNFRTEVIFKQRERREEIHLRRERKGKELLTNATA